MRLFIGIDIPSEVKSTIIKVQNMFKDEQIHMKYVDQASLHLTLKFLGEVNDAGVDGIRNVLADFSENKFTIHLEGLGFFGSPNFIKLVWAGISEGSETIVKIMNSLNYQLKHIRNEQVKPRPHLTIARVRDGIDSRSISQVLKSIKDMDIGCFQVGEIKLKRSVLTPKGPEYSDIMVRELV